MSHRDNLELSHIFANQDYDELDGLHERIREFQSKLVYTKTAIYAKEKYRRMRMRDLESTINHCTEKINIITRGEKPEPDLPPHRYKISRGELAKLISSQSGLCAICRTSLNEGFHVDHCHTWGVIRGALCRNCNIGLGNFRDDEKLLMRAAEYLQSKRPQVTS